MKLVKEELRGAKGEVETCRQKYDGMFIIYKGCSVACARAVVDTIRYTNPATSVVFTKYM